jgi:hypothetical protein
MDFPYRLQRQAHVARTVLRISLEARQQFRLNSVLPTPESAPFITAGEQYKPHWIVSRFLSTILFLSHW